MRWPKQAAPRESPPRPPLPPDPLPGRRHPDQRARTDVTFDHTAQAYIAAVADPSNTRITATVDHDGDVTLRQRLLVYITHAIQRPTPPTR
ncbi:MAG: hypothetical protein ACRDZO_27555 [Egibacteraceae bacterium]